MNFTCSTFQTHNLDSAVTYELVSSVLLYLILGYNFGTEAIYWLQIGTCHLPLQGLNHMLQQLLIFNTPWKEFRVESRNEALCAWGITDRRLFQIVRYFQEPILLAQFLYLPISRKTLNPSWWRIFIMTSKSFTKLVEIFWKNMYLITQTHTE